MGLTRRVCFCCGCAARLFVFCCGCGGGFHGRIEQNGMGWAWIKNSGPARLGSDRIGLAKERVGRLGDKQGGL